MLLNKIFIAAVFSLLLPFSVSAATLYLDPPSAVVSQGGVFEVKAKIGPADGECVNVGEIVLLFPKDVLEARDFDSGESIFSLWVIKPQQSDMEEINRAGKITFTGGLPGGYCGKIPGDPGESNILGGVIFSFKENSAFSQAEISFASSTRIFLNDGRGSAATIISQGAKMNVSREAAPAGSEWEERLAEDNIPPEPFLVELSQDARLAGGKYFLVFSTTDKQTGVDHYEVMEAKPEDLKRLESGKKEWFDHILKLIKKDRALPFYMKASSPYILKDQSLKSILRVKAIDRAGNERVSEYDNRNLDYFKIVAEKEKSLFGWPLMIAVVFLIILILSVPAIIINRRRLRR